MAIDVMKPNQIAPTFPGSYYCDPEIFEKEWEKIFHRAWLCVGRENNLSQPGDFMTVQVGHENILITRDKEGKRPIRGVLAYLTQVDRPGSSIERIGLPAK